MLLKKSIFVFTGVGAIFVPTILSISTSYNVKNVEKSNEVKFKNIEIFFILNKSKKSNNLNVNSEDFLIENYEENKEGFLKIYEDIKEDASKDNIFFNEDELSFFYDEYTDKAINIIQYTNSVINQRGFWKGLWASIKTVAGAVAGATTLGQVNSVNSFIKDSAREVYDNGGDIIECAGGIFGVTAGIATALKDGGDTLAHSLDQTDWECIKS